MQRIGIQEQEVQSLRKTFKETEFREDGELEIQKKGIVDKIVLIGANKDILKRKIQEAREATVFEQGKMVEIEADRNDLEKNILLMKAQNEGTKMVLRSLEEEN